MCDYRRISEELLYCSNINNITMLMREDMVNANRVVIEIVNKYTITIELDYYIISNKIQELGYKGFRL